MSEGLLVSVCGKCFSGYDPKTQSPSCADGHPYLCCGGVELHTPECPNNGMTQLGREHARRAEEAFWDAFFEGDSWRTSPLRPPVTEVYVWGLSLRLLGVVEIAGLFSMGLPKSCPILVPQL